MGPQISAPCFLFFPPSSLPRMHSLTNFRCFECQVWTQVRESLNKNYSITKTAYMKLLMPSLILIVGCEITHNVLHSSLVCVNSHSATRVASVYYNLQICPNKKGHIYPIVVASHWENDGRDEIDYNSNLIYCEKCLYANVISISISKTKTKQSTWQCICIYIMILFFFQMPRFQIPKITQHFLQWPKSLFM